MPVIKMLWNPPPPVAILGHVEDCVQHLKVGQLHVAPLDGEAIGDSLVLFLYQFHAPSMTRKSVF